MEIKRTCKKIARKKKSMIKKTDRGHLGREEGMVWRTVAPTVDLSLESCIGYYGIINMPNMY
jgi:hypothetical protein